MKHYLLLLCFFLSTVVLGNTYNIVDYGAKGDGEFLNTAAIQNAIDACYEHGGGTVFIPTGNFLTGTIILKSNVTLELSPGAVLLGSLALKDYPAYQPAFRSYTDVNYVSRSLIYAEKVRNVGIVGSGTIDGQGEEEAFQLGTTTDNLKKRPFILRFVECKDVKIHSIKLINAAGWVQHYLACENVNIDGIYVHSKVNANNDGLDIDCSKNVRVSNSTITSRDDAIVLKSTAPQPSENITITNCILSSDHYGFKCGTESTGGFVNIVFTNSVITKTRRAGIALEIVDGGMMDGVIVSNIVMEAEGGLFIRLGNRARPYLAKGAATSSEQKAHINTENIPVGSMKNIIISNVVGKNIGTLGCAISGIPGHAIENLTLQNLTLSFLGGGESEYTPDAVPELENKYPEVQMFGALPAFGLYVRHVSNLNVDNVSFSLNNADHRPALVFDDVKKLTLDRIETSDKATEKPIVFIKTTFTKE